MQKRGKKKEVEESGLRKGVKTLVSSIFPPYGVYNKYKEYKKDPKDFEKRFDRELNFIEDTGRRLEVIDSRAGAVAKGMRVVKEVKKTVKKHIKKHSKWG